MAVPSAASGVSHNQTSLRGFAQQRRQDAETQPPSIQPAETQGVQQNAGKSQAELKEAGVVSDMPARKHAGSDAASALAVSAYTSMSMGFQATSSISAEA